MFKKRCFVVVAAEPVDMSMSEEEYDEKHIEPNVDYLKSEVCQTSNSGTLYDFCYSRMHSDLYDHDVLFSCTLKYGSFWNYLAHKRLCKNNPFHVCYRVKPGKKAFDFVEDNAKLLTSRLEYFGLIEQKEKENKK